MRHETLGRFLIGWVFWTVILLLLYLGVSVLLDSAAIGFDGRSVIEELARPTSGV